MVTEYAELCMLIWTREDGIRPVKCVLIENLLFKLWWRDGEATLG